MQVVIPPSARLRYRLMDAADKEFWFEMDQDPEAMRYLNEGKPTSREDFDGWIVARFLSFTNPDAGLGLWEAADRNSGEALGFIIARHYHFDRPDREPDNIELGWRIKRAHWGRGLATEAARSIMHSLQQDPAIRAFSALASPDNAASISIMKKLGMRYVGERAHIVPGRPPYPSVYYEMPSPGYRQPA